MVVRHVAIALLCSATVHAATPDETVQALRKAAGFFQETVAVEGGYVWKYSADLARREGEGRATPTQIWVQPPGTPSIGEAFLAAYNATGDSYYLDAARQTAQALVRGQLASGGWDYKIDFDPDKRKNYSYKSDGGTGKSNITTLDDNTTQSALTFLIHIDQALAKSDHAIHDAVIYALDKLLAVQYPNGAWPQRFVEAPEPSKCPVLKASYPKSWACEWAARDYKSDYTFNDNSIADMIELMLLAHDAYGEARYKDAALRGGDFILLAQMPDPQPGWAQQYDAEMHPVWARKFEPPAITGNESQGVMRTLVDLFDKTGEKRFLLPIPRALAYYKSSLLPDGRLARFYELQTNKPLYFTKDYKLTYSSDDMPTHYGFIVGSGLEGIQAQYDRAISEGPKPRATRDEPTIDSAKIDEIIQALDPRGAWVESGKLDYHGDDDSTREIISSATFARNVRALGNFIKQSNNPKGKQ